MGLCLVRIKYFFGAEVPQRIFLVEFVDEAYITLIFGFGLATGQTFF